MIPVAIEIIAMQHRTAEYVMTVNTVIRKGFNVIFAERRLTTQPSIQPNQHHHQHQIQCYIRRASTDNPSNYPTKGPTLQPSYHPTPSPTSNPTSPPTSNPTSPTPSPTSIDDLFSLDLYAWKSTKSFHFYTTSSSEIQALQSDADGTNIGIIGQLAHTRQDGKGLPLYRLYSASVPDYFYTTNVVERDDAVAGGYTFKQGIYEGGIGYCFANENDVDGVTLVPLTRYHDSGSNRDHCYATPDSGVCDDSKYGDPEGIQCYIRRAPTDNPTKYPTKGPTLQPS
eukprot:618821_1